MGILSASRCGASLSHRMTVLIEVTHPLIGGLLLKAVRLPVANRPNSSCSSLVHGVQDGEDTGLPIGATEYHGRLVGLLAEHGAFAPNGVLWCTVVRP